VTVQDALNAYLEGAISEDKFLELARPWPNYREDYRPFVESRGLVRPLMRQRAREIAARVAMADTISPDVTGKDSVYLPRTCTLTPRNITNAFLP